MFNLMLADKPGKCIFVDKMLYFYFQRDTSAMHTASWERYAEMVKNIQLAKNKMQFFRV